MLLCHSAIVLTKESNLSYNFLFLLIEFLWVLMLKFPFFPLTERNFHLRCFTCKQCGRPQKDKLQVFIGTDQEIYCKVKRRIAHDRLWRSGRYWIQNDRCVGNFYQFMRKRKLWISTNVFIWPGFIKHSQERKKYNLSNWNKYTIAKFQSFLLGLLP